MRCLLNCARLNFVFFDDPEAVRPKPRTGSQEALETDIDWVRKHTEFGEHARRWDDRRPPRSAWVAATPAGALDEAERWIGSARAAPRCRPRRRRLLSSPAARHIRAAATVVGIGLAAGFVCRA